MPAPMLPLGAPHGGLPLPCQPLPFITQYKPLAQILKDTLVDEFVPAHILGWWGKTLMLRDPSMLWVISIGFELMEVTFRHWLPNFNECWWDSWILDFLICNNLGIWLGMFGREGAGISQKA